MTDNTGGFSFEEATAAPQSQAPSGMIAGPSPSAVPSAQAASPSGFSFEEATAPGFDTGHAPGMRVPGNSANQPSKTTGIGPNVGAGANETIASWLGAPVDILSSAMRPSSWNKLTPAEQSDFASRHPDAANLLQTWDKSLQNPIGGSESIKKAMGWIGANPDNVAAPTSSQRIARGVGSGLPMAMLPGGPVANAVIGGISGGAGAGAAEAVPEQYKPLAETAGNLVGGVGAAGTMALGKMGARAVGNVARSAVDLATKEGQKRLAGQRILGASTAPEELPSRLAVGSQEIVPGSKPTTFQATGDQGLGQLERDVARNNPEDFLARRAEQNAARVGAVQSMAPSAAQPSTTVDLLRQHLNAIDQQGQQATEAARNDVGRQVEAIGGQGEPQQYGAAIRSGIEAQAAPQRAITDQAISAAQGHATNAIQEAGGTAFEHPADYGEALRQPLTEAAAASKARLGALWDAVDPTGTLQYNHAPLKATAQGIVDEVAKNTMAIPMEGTEARVFDSVINAPNIERFENLQALRSAISDAMNERPSPSAMRRLGTLKSAVDDTVSQIGDDVAQSDQTAVQAGTRAPDDTLFARLQQARDQWYGRESNASRSAGQEIGGGLESNAAARPAGVRGTPGAEGAPGIGHGGPAGNPSVSPNSALEMHAPRATVSSPPSSPSVLVQPSQSALDNLRNVASQNVAAAVGQTAPASAEQQIVTATKQLEAQARPQSPSTAPQPAPRPAASIAQAGAVPISQQHFFTAQDIIDMAAAKRMQVPTPQEAQQFVDDLNAVAARRAATLASTIQSAPEPTINHVPVVPAVSVPEMAPKPIGMPTEQVPYQETVPTRGTRPAEDIAQQVAEARAGTAIEPTSAQIDAANYAKGRVSYHGIPFVMENPEGSIRRGVSADGTPWEAKLPADYGYISRTEGADGEHVDAFMGPNHDSQRAFVVDQIDPDTDTFDEHKVLLGFNDLSSARQAYIDAFSDGRGAARIGNVTPMSLDELKIWLKRGDTKSPVGDTINLAGLANDSQRTPESLSTAIEPALADRYAAARAATVQHGETFERGPVGQMLKRGAYGRPYAADDSLVASRFFNSGKTAEEDVQAFSRAAGDRADAANLLQDYAAFSLRRAVMNPDGSINPTRFQTWMRAHQDALHAFPELTEKFRNIKAAQDTLTSLVKQRQALEDSFPLRPGLADADVASRYWRPGPSGAENIGAFLQAVGNRSEALKNLTDYAAWSLRQAAMNTDGTLNSTRYLAWMKRYGSALSRVPEVQQSFEALGRAQDTLDKAMAEHKAEVDAYQDSAARFFLNGDDPVRAVGRALRSPQDFSDLVDLVNGDQAAIDGLKKAVVDHILNVTQGNIEGADTGVNLLKSDVFQNFLKANRVALSKLFVPKEVENLKAVATDLRRANRSVAGTKVPGGSDTFQNIATAHRLGAGMSILQKIVWHAAGAAAGSLVGMPIAGWLGGAAAEAIKSAGISRVDQLVKEAMLDPQLATLLLKKVPAKPEQTIAKMLASRLRAITALSATSGLRQAEGLSPRP